MISALILGLTLVPAALEVSVDGDGYLRFAKNARAVYAKSAQLAVKDGALVHASGPSLLPPVSIPAGATGVTIDLEGNVEASVNGSKVKVGRLVIAIFDKTASLAPEESFLTASIRPSLGNPGEATHGVIRMNGDKTARNAAIVNKPAAPPTSIYKTTPTPPPVAAKTNTYSGPPQIVISHTAEVSTDRFTLGDIATVKAQDGTLESLLKTPIGDTPCIGVARGIDRGQVVSKLRQAGFRTEDFQIDIPGGATVRRASQLVEADQFREIAIAEVRKTLGAEIPLEAEVPKSEFRTPTGELKLQVESCVQNNANFSVIVVAYVDGKRFNSRVIKVQPEASAMVKAGQEVTITLRSGGAAVELSGKTRAAAFVGQSVTVTTKEGKTLNGILLSSGRVEVRL